MSIPTQLAGDIYQPPPYPVRRFTVEEYHQLIQKGILNEDDRVELLEGWIVPKMPRNPPHDVTINKAQEVFLAHLPPGWKIRVQSAITTETSEPEPDFAIVLGPPERFLHHHPKPDEVAVVIEVADSSLNRDREEKAKLYARARIPVYWIINLVDGQVEVYSKPSGPEPHPGYRRREDYRVNESAPLAITGHEVAQIQVRDLLPSLAETSSS
jgi:Uma2 family endonuclease